MYPKKETTSLIHRKGDNFMSVGFASFARHLSFANEKKNEKARDRFLEGPEELSHPESHSSISKDHVFLI